MCLLAVAWRATPTERLVLIGNRDEFHTRAAAPMDWWPAPAGFLGGRDLQAGGAWLGVDRQGRFAVVTNFRGRPLPAGNLPSRGDLVPRYLSGELDAADYAALVEREAARYAGFSLLIGDDRELWYVTNRQAGARRLEPGLYGLSNDLLDVPWHKLVTTRERLRVAVTAGDLATGTLLDLLQDAAPAPDAVQVGKGLDPEFARRISATFVSDPQYGTRCSSVLLLRSDGTAVAAERSFDAHAAVQGERVFPFDLAAPTVRRAAG
jgi:uncharacterized protein with NRDE domain